MIKSFTFFPYLLNHYCYFLQIGENEEDNYKRSMSPHRARSPIKKEPIIERKVSEKNKPIHVDVKFLFLY